MNDGWSGQRVLVTGARGFLGSWLTDRLVREGSTVFALVRRSTPDQPPGSSSIRQEERTGPPSAHWRACDLLDLAGLSILLESEPFDVVFHLAGQSAAGRSSIDPLGTLKANVTGTWNLMEAVRRLGRRVPVVAASSYAIYGRGGAGTLTEDAPLPGSSPYAVSKICSELVIRCYRDHYGLPVGTARMCNLYGGRDPSRDRIVPSVILSVLRGDAPVIRGDGRDEKEYLYVEDAVDALIRLAEALCRPEPLTGVFNFGTGDPISVSALVDAILTVMGRTDLEPVIQGRAEDRESRIQTSSSQAEQRLGWAPVTPLERGLEATVDWYRCQATEIGDSSVND